jgi:hypothetical protein
MNEDLKLHIKVVDGLPTGHPAFEVNLLDAFGEVPADWEPFVRVPDPRFTDKTIELEHPTPVYRKIDGVWYDVWYTRPKTPEELQAEYDARFGEIIAAWKNRPYANNFSAWVLNEQKGFFEPPTPRPSGPGFYRWSGPDNNWKLAPPFPQDGKQYTFDFDNWINVEIV